MLQNAKKNGSNGRVNSMHIMEDKAKNGSGGEGEGGTGQVAEDSQENNRRRGRGIIFWRARIGTKWGSFKEERSDYSLWIFKPDDR